MSLANVSIKRPIFITCVIIGILVGGIAAFKSMSVDLFPDVSIPVVTVQTVYQGAGPQEIETLVSKPLEDEIASISGIKRLKSRNLEGVSILIIEFNDDKDSKVAEQEVRDKVNIAKADLPDEVEDPVIKKFDPADTPIVYLSLTAEGLGDGELFDLADRTIKPRLEQVDNVGAVEIIGGRKREIHVLLDRNKLKSREISVSQVASQVGAMGENIPAGKVSRGEKELVFRGVGEFSNVPEVADTLVNLYGNEVPTRVADLGIVKDTLEDETSRSYLGDKRVLTLQVYRQAGSNTLKVAQDIKKKAEAINVEFKNAKNAPKLDIIVDSSIKIEDNVNDVYETIIIGIILTVITVFFFLGSVRSTLITALSLPVSLIGAFVLIGAAGFTINIVTLLALTLAVGLLIDDAIVVIENVYRFMEKGYDSKEAAQKATAEIQMAVIAITLVVMAVFVPVAMMSGTIGQFLKSFGLTVAFSMAISLFVALTIIPMLAAYFGGEHHDIKHIPANPGVYDKTLGRMVRGFDRFQTWLENIYEKFVTFTLKSPLATIGATLFVFFFSFYVAGFLPGEFVPDDDSGELNITLELAPGTNIDETARVAKEIKDIVQKNDIVDFVLYTAGNENGEVNKATYVVKLKHERHGIKTEDFRNTLREQLVAYRDIANPIVKKFDTSGMGRQPVILNITSPNAEALERSAMKVFEAMKKDPRLVDVDSNYRTGKPELQVKVKPGKAKEYGINTKTLGAELRAQVEGATPAVFRENGQEYDVRVRLLDEQRDLKKLYNQVYVPNINHRLVKLSDIANGVETTGPASIERMNRGRFIELSSGLKPGVGLNQVMAEYIERMTKGDLKLEDGVNLNLGGDAEDMAKLMTSTMVAVGFGILVIYLILSSLYESFITPITIMLSLPLAISGAFFGLFLTGKSINLFAIFGFFMLIGVAGKNGILMVDFAKVLMEEGRDRFSAIIEAGKTRLRPILMTSFALIAGTLPIAYGLNPASRTRTSMGVAIIAGVALSTILTLVVLPSIFVYIDRFRVWANKFGTKMTTNKEKNEHAPKHEVAVETEGELNTDNMVTK